MTTPKELADKAMQQADVRQDAWHDYMNALRIDVHGEIVSTSTAHLKAHNNLRATIDQLQAMAEARQGSGEPVAEDRAALARLLVGISRATGLSADDRKTLSFAAELVAAPPSAQQATGSGQVLTDDRITEVAFVVHGHAQGTLGSVMFRKGVRYAEYIAAATQAQPEHRRADPAEEAAIDDLLGLAELPPIRMDFAAFNAIKKLAKENGLVVQAQVRSMLRAYLRTRLAAPTTGKREPLTVWAGDVAELAVVHGIYREPDEEDVQAFAKAILAATKRGGA